MPRPPECRSHEPYGSVSVSFENALYSLDKETGLLDGAVRALNAIDAVGICEAHGTSLRVFARALGWDVEMVEFGLNHHATGQRTLEDLSRAEMNALTSLNLIDAQVYSHAMGKLFRLCSQYGIELNESERSALTQRAEFRSSRVPNLTRLRLTGRLREFANSISRRTQNVALSGPFHK